MKSAASVTADVLGRAWPPMEPPQNLDKHMEKLFEMFFNLIHV
jgi:hypothetical protein